MRRVSILLLVLLFSTSLVAQERTGNIYGTVVDQEGMPLPGVTVTLTGMYTAPLRTISSDDGQFRFLSLSPSRDYTIKLELAGFKTKIEENIIVTVGRNTTITFSMEMGALEEEVTVTAVSPVVDAKKTSVGSNIGLEALQSLPSARDPWVFLKLAPGTIADREDVGGTDTGMQSSIMARGASSYAQNQWNIDGVMVTDPAAIGASITYYDFDAFEEMNISVGGSDVTTQTSGIALNLVTRRGGNRVSLGGRFYVTDGKKFQADNMKEEFRKEGLLGTNKIRRIEDYGVNFGLPIIRDKMWFWASYGVQDIKSDTILGGPWDMLLTNYAAKLNLQLIPQNRIEVFIHSGNKEMWGRGASASNPEGLYQGTKYHFGTPIVKSQIEHMFGDNILASLKHGYTGGGFHLTPMTDLKFEKQAVYDVTAARYYGSQASRYWCDRPQHQFTFTTDYFNDSLFGASHEFKLGAEFNVRSAYTESVWSGNYILYRNFNTPVADFDGDGKTDIPPSNFYRLDYWRGYYEDLAVKQFAGFFRDTITFGRFNVLIGLRYDHQIPRVDPFDVIAVDKDSKAWTDYFTPKTIDLLDKLLPAAKQGQVKATAKDGSAYAWRTFSPRLGLTWDVTGNGKTIAKLSLGQYGNFMGVGEAWRWKKGGTGGWVDVHWWDLNRDGKIDFTELYWWNYRASPLYQLYRIYDDAGNFTGKLDDAAGQFWGDFDIRNPLALVDPYRVVDANAQSPRTSEAILTLERELFTDAAVSLNATYRKYDKFTWALKYFPATGEVDNQGWYISAGKLPATIPGVGSTKDAAKYDYYYASTLQTRYSPYTWEQTMPSDRYNEYLGFDLIFTKRLSNKWMFDASFTWQHQVTKYGKKGYLSPNNIWAYEGAPIAPLVGGAAGKIDQYAHTTWLFKFAGLYQLPFDINVSATFNARQGWIIREYFTIVNYTLPNPASRSFALDLTPFGSERLPNLYHLDVRVEKMIKAGDFGRIYVMADFFNANNAATAIRRYQKNHGTYYYYGEGSASNRFVAEPTFNRLNEIINPFVVRFGVRFSY
ncbi:MAG: carboxypeptidase regulatory-like domain-containing protein [Clostridiales bacterium]|nr:carboxypeptidase regulatory-like domain-containing protein [Clostridiales bacterium]